MKTRLIPILIAVAADCTSGTPDRKITLTGSSTIAPLMVELGKLYEQQNPGTRVEVQMGGSSRGARDAREQLADLGMISRALKAEETELEAHLLARDGIALIAHRDNPVKELSKDQVVQIYTGKINNWSALGGKDAPISVVHKAEGRSTLELFLEHFQLKPAEVKAQVIIGDNQQGIKTIAGDPNAIGYVSIGSAMLSANAGDPIRSLVLDGVVPSVASVKDGSYPLARPLNLVSKKGVPLPPQVAKLIELVRSKEAADVVASQGFVAIE